MAGEDRRGGGESQRGGVWWVDFSTETQRSGGRGEELLSEIRIPPDDFASDLLTAKPSW
jgi:hypothetical protein